MPPTIRYEKFRATTAGQQTIWAVVRIPFDLKDEFKAAVPFSAGRQWLPSIKAWVVPDELFQRLTWTKVREHGLANLAISALGVKGWVPNSTEAHRRERAESARSAHQDAPGGRNTSSPWATLHLTPNAPLEVARAAYRAMALLCPPDQGGSEAEMKRVNAAWQEIEPTLRSGRR
jgi:hypothetical protein